MNVYKALGQIVAATPDETGRMRKRMIDADKLVIANNYGAACEAVMKFYSISDSDAAKLIRNNPICSF